MLLLIVSCSEIPDKYPCNNDKDPDCEGYVHPGASISNNITNGEVFDTNVVIISWYGKQLNSTFSYRLSISNEWSGWSNAKSIIYNCLQDGNYTFYVQEAYANGDIQSGFTEINFVVHYINMPSIVLENQCIDAEISHEFEVDISLEEIDKEVMGVYLLISFDSEKIKLTDDEVLLSFLSSSLSDLVFIPTDITQANNDGLLEINLARFGGQPDHSNPNKIVALMFQAMAKGSTMVMVQSNSELRDANNEVIKIDRFINSTINIQ